MESQCMGPEIGLPYLLDQFQILTGRLHSGNPPSALPGDLPLSAFVGLTHLG